LPSLRSARSIRVDAEFDDRVGRRQFALASPGGAGWQRQPGVTFGECVDRFKSADYVKIAEDVGQPFRCERGIDIAHMEVQMRSVCVSSLPKRRDHLTSLYMVAASDTDAARLEVLVERVAPLSQIQSDVVSAGVFQCAGNPGGNRE
jgi:hypothetical protein